MLIRSMLAVLIAVACVRVVAAQSADVPKVVIYSFAGGDGVPATMGAQIADTLATDAQVGGGVAIVRGAKDLTPDRYRDDARAQDADFYLIGSVATVGAKYSVLEQLVRVRTGLLLWSVSYQITGATDLAGQGSTVRLIVLDQASRTELRALAYGPAAAPAATPTPTPQPASRAAQLDLPPPAPPTARPASAYAVTTLGGNALAGDRAFAAMLITNDIRRRGVTAETSNVVVADLAAGGNDVCSATGAATLVGGTLDTKRVETLTTPPVTTAQLVLQFYDCRTHALVQKPLAATKTQPIGTDAIRSAVDDAADAYFGSAPPVPKV